MECKANNQAIAQMESIIETMHMLNTDYERLQELKSVHEDNPYELTLEEREELEELLHDANGCETYEDARRIVEETPLSVEVRSGWRSASSHSELYPVEYRIVLCTGGPHVEIKGRIDLDGNPETADIFYRGFSTSGKAVASNKERESILEFVSYFIGG